MVLKIFDLWHEIQRDVVQVNAASRQWIKKRSDASRRREVKPVMEEEDDQEIPVHRNLQAYLHGYRRKKEAVMASFFNDRVRNCRG